MICATPMSMIPVFKDLEVYQTFRKSSAPSY